MSDARVPVVYPTLLLKLKFWMERRNVTAAELAKASGVNQRIIEKYCTRKMKRFDADVLVRLAAPLRIEVKDLFDTVYDDLWTALCRCGEVVIHVTSRSFAESRTDKVAEDASKQVARELISFWDHRACQTVRDLLFDLGVRCYEQPHALGTAKAAGHTPGDVWQQISDGRAHVIIGSPATSDFAEAVVSAIYRVPPYTVRNCKVFPYNILWRSTRNALSSFGISWKGAHYGIVLTQSGKIVARRTMIESGRGEDGALIVVYRVPVNDPNCGRREGIVIALLGISGPGTLASALVAFQQLSAARELYPQAVDEPLMRAVTVNYARPRADATRDNRELEPGSWRLVSKHEEQTATEFVPSEVWPDGAQADGGQIDGGDDSTLETRKDGEDEDEDPSAE